MSNLLLPCARRAALATISVLVVMVPAVAGSAWLAGTLLAPPASSAPPTQLASAERAPVAGDKVAPAR